MYDCSLKSFLRYFSFSKKFKYPFKLPHLKIQYIPVIIIIFTNISGEISFQAPITIFMAENQRM